MKYSLVQRLLQAVFRVVIISVVLTVVVTVALPVCADGPGNAVELPKTISPEKLIVVSTAVPDNIPEPGGEVSFTIEVTNASPGHSVQLLKISDDFDNDGTDDITYTASEICQNTFLAPPPAGNTTTCSFSRHLIGNGGDMLTERITVTGFDKLERQAEGRDTAAVNITDIPSAIQVDKIVEPTILEVPGGPVTYVVTVTNISAVDGVSITGINDSDFGGDIREYCNHDPAGPAEVDFPATLAPGAVITCTTPGTVISKDGERIVKTASADGIDDDGNPVSDDGSATVIIQKKITSVGLEKFVMPEQIPEPGGPVKYLMEITNASAEEGVTINRVQYSEGGDLTPQDCSPNLPAVLAPGEMAICTTVRIVEGNAGEIIENTATASGTNDDGQGGDVWIKTRVKILDIPSSIQVIKRVSPTMVGELGGAVTFTVKVANTSAIDTVTLKKIDDPGLGGDISGFCNNTLPVELKPGENITCTIPHVIEAAGGKKKISSIASASGTDDDGNPVKSSGNAIVTFEHAQIDLPEKIPADFIQRDDDNISVLPVSHDPRVNDCESASGECDDILETSGTGTCMGKITELSMVYHGPFSEHVMIKDMGSRELFSGDIYPDEPFSFTGKDNEGTCTSEIKIYVNWRYHITLKTDCSIDIGPGFRSGDFEIVRGRSSYGDILGSVDQ